MATKYFVAPVVALQCYALATPRRSKLEYSMRGNIEAFVDEINKFTRIKRSFYLHLIYIIPRYYLWRTSSFFKSRL